MVITTSNNVEGYEISEYLQLVSGTDIYLIGGLMGGGLSNQDNLFTHAREKAMRTLTQQAVQCGADAVIGVQQSYSSPGEANYMVLALTGTAVKLKKVVNETFDRSIIKVPVINYSGEDQLRFGYVRLAYDLGKNDVLMSLLGTLYTDTAIEACKVNVKLYTLFRDEFSFPDISFAVNSPFSSTGKKMETSSYKTQIDVNAIPFISSAEVTVSSYLDSDTSSIQKVNWTYQDTILTAKELVAAKNKFGIDAVLGGFDMGSDCFDAFQNGPKNMCVCGFTNPDTAENCSHCGRIFPKETKPTLDEQARQNLLNAIQNMQTAREIYRYLYDNKSKLSISNLDKIMLTLSDFSDQERRGYNKKNAAIQLVQSALDE